MTNEEKMQWVKGDMRHQAASIVQVAKSLQRNLTQAIVDAEKAIDEDRPEVATRIFIEMRDIGNRFDTYTANYYTNRAKYQTLYDIVNQ